MSSPDELAAAADAERLPANPTYNNYRTLTPSITIHNNSNAYIKLKKLTTFLLLSPTPTGSAGDTALQGPCDNTGIIDNAHIAIPITFG